MKKLIYILFIILLFSCSGENNESNKNLSASPSNNQSEELTFSNTEILNTDVNCEEFDTHVYCISKTAPVAKNIQNGEL
ncbi:MAG: hypothetical protein ACJ0GV_02260 [Dehalococcoidia bacterium]